MTACIGIVPLGAVEDYINHRLHPEGVGIPSSEFPLALGEIRLLFGRQTNERRVRKDLATLKAKDRAESARYGARWKSP